MKSNDHTNNVEDVNQVEQAAEPVSALLRDDISTIGYDIDNWPGMPLAGPANMDDARQRIHQAEQEIDEGIGFSWDMVMTEARSIANRYETTVY